MTKREKAILQTAIDELTEFLEIPDLSQEDRDNVENRKNALEWFLGAVSS